MSRITLRKGVLEAVIDPAHGGNLVSFSCPSRGLRSLRTPPEDWAVQNVYLYGTPPLFPPNRIAGGRFTCKGRDYQLPVNEPATGCFLHGTLHRMPFEVTARAEDAASLCYRAKALEYLDFPHAFTIRLSYRLSEEGLVQTIAVCNDSTEEMPVAIGYHTTFALPFVEGSTPEDVRLRVGVGEEFARDMNTFLPTWERIAGSPLKNALCEGKLAPCRETLSRHFRQDAAHQMILTDVRTGDQLVYDTPDFDFWMIYNGGAKDFICAEPQTWVNDAPHAPFPAKESGFVALLPGETREYRCMLHFE